MSSPHAAGLWATIALLLVYVCIAGCGDVHLPNAGAPGTGGGAGGGALPPGPVAPGAYAGSARCQGCHPTQYADHHDSGHPYQLSKVEGGQAPTFPNSSLPRPPSGLSWNDVAYVIGGYAWMARFIDADGYIVTGAEVQYNLDSGQWVEYEAQNPPGTKPYDCGRCHTTGWEATGSAGPHQDGRPGMYGTFSEPGVTCEACHGPGGTHTQTMSKADIVRNPSAAACGTCHVRDTQGRIQAAGGFIRDEQQYDEMMSSRHATLNCVSCHHHHRGVRNQGAFGLVATCEGCHPAQASRTNHKSVADCVTCHMPRASLAATAQHEHQADVRTHIFKIHAAADDSSAMWYSQGGEQFSNGFVTLDLICYQCHRDENGVGGSTKKLTLAQLSARATGIHN